MNWESIKKAFELVESGAVKRIDVDDSVVVYRAGTVIRIDIKNK